MNYKHILDVVSIEDHEQQLRRCWDEMQGQAYRRVYNESGQHVIAGYHEVDLLAATQFARAMRYRTGHGIIFGPSRRDDAETGELGLSIINTPYISLSGSFCWQADSGLWKVTLSVMNGQTEEKLSKTVYVDLYGRVHAIVPDPWPGISGNHFWSELARLMYVHPGMNRDDCIHPSRQYEDDTSDAEDTLPQRISDYVSDYISDFNESDAGRDHNRLLEAAMKHAQPTDYTPFGDIDDNDRGADCSCGCIWFRPLEGDHGADWGVCANAEADRFGLITFEHQAGYTCFTGSDEE